jgi:hypothetical protein
MRLSQLVASTTLLASVLVLNSAAFADSRDNRLTLSAAMDAQVFPYGVRQGFKVLGDTKGKTCNFAYSVSLNGAYVGGQGPISAKLSPGVPWASDDLRLPTSGGGNYSLLVAAIDPAPGPTGANGCKGQVTLSFAVVPETGKLTGLTTSAKVVAVNQIIRFRVSGKTFGTCKFNSGFGVQGSKPSYSLIDTATNPLPFDYSNSYTQAGDYFVTAE